MYKHAKDVIDVLDERVRATSLPSDVNILVVFGYPRSDIGKGTLVSHLLALLDDVNLIKFDGLLNTDLDGRFTAADHDDFGLYTAQKPAIKISQQNHILGGSLFRDFITTYGETNERLTFIPHLERFFRLQIQEKWQTLGKPKHLILEMGGTPDDAEVGYALAGIRELKMQLNDKCQILLLTELGYNNLFAKSRTAQRGISELVSRGLVPNIVLTREPHLEQDISTSDRLDFESQMQERITERAGIRFKNIISVPYFTEPNRSQYGEFIKRNVLPLIQDQQEYNKLFIGTSDEPEIAEWKILLSSYFDLSDPVVLGLDIEIQRDDPSLQRGAYKRARAYSRASGMPSITSEAGLYIHALGGKPGAGVRTWGGELAKPLNNEELFAYLQKQVEPLEDTSAYIEENISIVLPNGESYHLQHRDYGRIDKKYLAKSYKPGEYPIGQVFKHDKFNATWVEMSKPSVNRHVRKLLNKFSHF